MGTERHARSGSASGLSGSSPKYPPHGKALALALWTLVVVVVVVVADAAAFAPPSARRVAHSAECLDVLGDSSSSSMANGRHCPRT